MIGKSNPVFEIADFFAQDDIRDLLVRNERHGAALAACFSNSAVNGATQSHQPEHAAVLMRGHGITIVGGSIEETVARAVYTAENAAIQTASLSLSNAYFKGSEQTNDIQYLRPDELEPTSGMTKWSNMRPWNLWLREAESVGLYQNNSA